MLSSRPLSWSHKTILEQPTKPQTTTLIMASIMKHPNSEDQDDKRVYSDQKRQQEVSFCGQVRGLRTLHLNDYTPSEIEATWFTSDDYKRIRQEMFLTLELVQESGNEIDETQYCQRGLERWSQTVMTEEDHERRRHAIDGVLDEQELQRQEGINDKDLIAIIYSRISHKSKATSRLLGVEDAKNSQQVTPQNELSQKVANSYDEVCPTRRRSICSATLLQFSPPVA